MKRLAEIECSRFSQNGEDGIIGYLLGDRKPGPRFFIEIGSGNGKQNNTSYLAAQGWHGLAVDRNKERIKAYNVIAGERGWLSLGICQRATRDFTAQLARAYPAPTVFSLDIDSVDWHIARAMLGAGFRPNIAVVEYNAAFGDRPLTVPYSEDFRTPAKHLYFGAGLRAWRNLFEPVGYRFVTVESSGVNAFFVLGDHDGLAGVRWLGYADNRRHAEEIGPAEERFARMAHMEFVECP